MKKLILLVIFTVFYSCSHKNPYPKYSLTIIEHIPDSLKAEYREWVKETVRAASQHMTGGDYEDADDTIEQAQRTGKKVFSVDIIGLKKEIDDKYYNNIYLIPEQMNGHEKKMLDSLLNTK